MRSSRRFAIAAGMLALAAAVALTGCLDGADRPRAGDPVTVYVSLALRGPAGADGRDAADGARLALAEAEGTAGGHEVSAVFLDDTAGRGAAVRWSPGRVGGNARRATRDASAIAYIGELESGATRTSLPITNEARILQVSPASSAEDLVREAGTFDGVPEELQPSGERTFGRVIPSDRAQARAGADWAAEQGSERAWVIVERSVFGRTVADAFAEQAAAAGIELERGRLERFLRDLREQEGPGGACVVARAQAALPLLYLAGEDGRALSDLSCRPLYDGPFMATDALLSPIGRLDAEQRGRAAHLTSAAQDPSQLPPAGQDLVERFRREYAREPGRYAAYGYEAMAVVLDAIERAGEGGADRTEVIDAFLATADRDSVLGTYSIESTGETTLDRMTGYRVERGRARPIAELRAPGR